MTKPSTKLETFPNPRPGRDFTVSFECHDDFTYEATPAVDFRECRNANVIELEL